MSTIPNPIKVGVIGVGRIGKCHLESLTGFSGVIVTMVRRLHLLQRVS
jgi:lactate dehydrogenase-like 2-hydroxyacid dehydrogenase